MGTSAGRPGPSGPATPVGAGGAAVPAGTTGNATGTGAGASSGKLASITPVRGPAPDDERFAESENPEADAYIAQGKQEKKDRIAKQKTDAQEGAGSETSAARNKGQQGNVASGGKRQGGKRATDTGEGEE